MSGLEPAGAAASIVGLAQAGLCLAKALNEFVGAVSDANDDIAAIADDIYATYRHLNDLAWVLKQNETTKCMTEDAITSAQTCAKKAEVLVQKLRKLLVKGGGSSLSTSDIQPDDIDITKFRKGIWYIYKSEFELRQAQLHSIKTDISMVYLGYLAMSGASANERKQATEEMELLFNRQTALHRGIQKARRKRDRISQAGADPHTRRRNPARDILPGYSDDEEELYEGDGGPEVVYDTVDDVYKEFENWLAKKQKSDADKAAVLKKTKEDAVAQYLNEQKGAEKKVIDDMEKLRKALDAQGVPPGRVGPIVKAAFPEADFQQVHISKGADASGQRSSNSTVAGKGGFTRKSSWFRRTFRDPTDEASSVPESVPDVLKDSALPGGLAQLKALYFQKIKIAPGWTEIAKLDVAVPDYRLVPKLLCSQSQNANKGILSPFLHGFAEVPEDYRYHIVKELTSAIYEDGEKWTVLQIEPVKSQQSRVRFSKRSKNHVVGIYVILRKVSTPDNFFSIEAEKHQSLQAMPEDGTARLKATIEETTSQPATILDYIPEQAGTYVSRTKSKEKEPELAYASNLRGSEYATASGPQRRSGSPHVSFADNYIRVEPRGSRNRPRYFESSDESDNAGFIPMSYASPSRPRRTSAAPSGYPRESYRGYEHGFDHEQEYSPQFPAPMPMPLRSNTMPRGGRSPYHSNARSKWAAEPAGFNVENYMDVPSRRYSREGRITDQAPPSSLPKVIPIHVAHQRKGRGSSRERTSGYHGHVYSDSDDDDAYYRIPYRNRSRDKSNHSPRFREYIASDVVEDIERRAGERRKPGGKKAHAVLEPEAMTGLADQERSFSQQYEPVPPIRLYMGDSEAHRTAAMRKSASRTTAPAIYHYGTRASARPRRQYSRSPTGFDPLPVTSKIGPDPDLISEVSSDDGENTSTSWPRINSKEAVRSKLESWTNKAVHVPLKEAGPTKADDMPPTGPLSRRTTFDVEATETTNGEPTG